MDIRLNTLSVFMAHELDFSWVKIVTTGVANRNQDPVKTFYDYYKISLHHNAAAN